MAGNQSRRGNAKGTAQKTPPPNQKTLDTMYKEFRDKETAKKMEENDAAFADSLAFKENMRLKLVKERARLNAALHDLLPKMYSKVDRYIENFPQHYNTITVEFEVQYIAFNALAKFTPNRNELKSRFFKRCPDSEVNYILNEIVKVGVLLKTSLVEMDIVSSLDKLQSLLKSMDSDIRIRFQCLLQSVVEDEQKLFLKQFLAIAASGSLVYGSFHKVIINTNEDSLSQAKLRFYIWLKDIQSRDRFEFIEFGPPQFWCSLLFMNEFNYCGVPEESLFTIKGKQKTFIMDREVDAKETKFYWSIVLHLPKKAQVVFGEIFTDYLRWTYEVANSRIIGVGNLFAFIVEAYVTPWNSQQEEEKLAKKKGKVHISEVSEPDALNASNKHAYVLREFVRAFFIVLSLTFDKSEDLKTWVLFSYIRTTYKVQFDADYKFENKPCRSLILPNVICRQCLAIRDLDLCCNSSLTYEVWRCEKCYRHYDPEEITYHILNLMHDRVAEYQKQNLICPKCNLVSESFMSAYCVRCKGPLQLSTDKQQWKDDLDDIRSIFKMHNLDDKDTLEQFENMV